MKSHPFPVFHVRSLLFGPYPRLVTVPAGTLFYLALRLSPLFDKTVTAPELQQMSTPAPAPAPATRESVA